MLASECLQMIIKVYKTEGPSGLLPQNLPEALIEAIANQSEGIEEHDRKHLVACICSLLLYGEVDVDRFCDDKINIAKFPILWSNIVLEDCVRTFRPKGYTYPTLDNIFEFNRPALKVTKNKTLNPVQAIEHLFAIGTVEQATSKIGETNKQRP